MFLQQALSVNTKFIRREDESDYNPSSPTSDQSLHSACSYYSEDTAINGKKPRGRRAKVWDNELPPDEHSKVYLCTAPNCRKVFKRNEHLIRHMRMHTGEKPYSCTLPDCQKKFTRCDNLIAHMARTHKINPKEARKLVGEQRIELPARRSSQDIHMSPSVHSPADLFLMPFSTTTTPELAHMPSPAIFTEPNSLIQSPEFTALQSVLDFTLPDELASLMDKVCHEPQPKTESSNANFNLTALSDTLQQQQASTSAANQSIIDPILFNPSLNPASGTQEPFKLEDFFDFDRI